MSRIGAPVDAGSFIVAFVVAAAIAFVVIVVVAIATGAGMR